MILYRFSHQKYARDLSGLGAKLYGGRWNPIGIPVIYASESISLGLLEVLVNAGTLRELQSLALLEMDIPFAPLIHEVKLSGLKKEWLHDIEYTQWLGQEILSSKKSLLIKCPSAIIQKESNYLINPLHGDFRKIKLLTASHFHFDDRLFKPQKKH